MKIIFFLLFTLLLISSVIAEKGGDVQLNLDVQSQNSVNNNGSSRIVDEQTLMDILKQYDNMSFSNWVMQIIRYYRS